MEENNYLIILKELNKYGVGQTIDIKPLLEKILTKPERNDEYFWREQRNKAFEPLIELLKNNHIEYDRQQTIDRITYNFGKDKQPWLDAIQNFDAKITPLGVSYLQQLANEKLTQSVIDTNRMQKFSAIASFVVSLIALIISGVSLSKDDSKELQKINKSLKSQVQVLQNMLQVQKENGSFHQTTAKDSLKKK